MDLPELGLNVKVPFNFLKGIRLVPHNFHFPEDPKHGQYVHDQLRFHLYNLTFFKVTNIEKRNLKKDSDFAEIKGFDQKDCLNLSLLHKLILKKHKSDEEDEFIACENWKVNRSDKETVSYRVHYYQSLNDQFYSIVFPPSLTDTLFGYYTGIGL